MIPEAQQLYKDHTRPVEDRVESLLEQMTLDEKLAQLGCLWSTALVSEGGFDPDLAASKMPHGIGQVTRIGASTGLHPRDSAAFMNAIQHERNPEGCCREDAPRYSHLRT
ncbi:MAG: hypothetical protein M3Q29_01995 [Chloroflexota bacterium]|nr:hypothetical protein [Chloroflexota bacterium]